MDKNSKIYEFNTAQIKKQLAKQVSFLMKVHPSLMEDGWNQGAVELRPLKRIEELKYQRSYTTWRLEDKDVTALEEFLTQINGKEFCLYFSSFAFDYQKDVIVRKNGKDVAMRKGKINNSNALYTTILAMDFDNMGIEEFQEEKKRLQKLGIETLDVFTGHGYQSYILLKHRVTDLKIMKKFTNLMMAKGFKVDGTLVDAARVLRMPYSFNFKAVNPKFKYYDPIAPEIKPTRLITDTDERYHVTEIFEKIGSLPDVIPQEPEERLTQIDIESIPTEPLFQPKKSDKQALNAEKEEQTKAVQQVAIDSLRTSYSRLNLEGLPLPVQKMLSGTQQGLRNEVILFLVPFLRNSLGLSKESIVENMQIWGGLCEPALEPDEMRATVNRIYSYDFKGKHGKYSTNLTKAYGYLDFSSYGEYRRNNKIIIPNEMFDDFDVINDGAIRIYLAMKLAEKRVELKQFTKADIMLHASISKSTLERNMKDLVRLGYVSKKRNNRRNKEPYTFYLNPYFNATVGYTMLETSLVKLMLEELSPEEMKLYVYLCKIIGNQGNSVWMSQKKLAQKIGKKGHNSISQLTDKLDSKRFIRKKTMGSGVFTHSTYTLIY